MWVIGLGHPLMGDDAVGLLAVDELAAREWPGVVEFYRSAACTPDVLPSYTGGGALHIVIIDAVEAGGPPGAVWVATCGPTGWEGPPLICVSMHGFGVDHLLSWLSLAGMRPESVTIVGVEAASIEPAEGLSPEVLESWDRLLRVAAHEIIGKIRGAS